MCTDSVSPKDIKALVLIVSFTNAAVNVTPKYTNVKSVKFPFITWNLMVIAI